jgi:hypothetical protein
MKAQKVQARTVLGQMHDPGLGGLGLKAHARQRRRDHHEGILGFASGLAHHHEIVGVTDEHPDAMCLPFPV